VQAYLGRLGGLGLLDLGLGGVGGRHGECCENSEESLFRNLRAKKVSKEELGQRKQSSEDSSSVTRVEEGSVDHRPGAKKK
jgi:hypothetical protein